MRALLAVLMFACASASAQTTFILVRHAEKETGNDPVLTTAGQQRALSLVKLLEQQKVDAIYSTNFNRTKSTVKPLADAKGINIQSYEKEPDIEKLLKAGGTVVICGHSNTIPALANKLLGKQQFTNYADDDYGNLLIINGASVTHLRY
ncbi:MAG TPA: phosphoglycerate mutase family protein [Cyclobacteriaceae bacterium]